MKSRADSRCVVRLDSLTYADVVRYLRRHADYFATMRIQDALSETFLSVNASTAHYCFYNCFR